MCAPVFANVLWCCGLGLWCGVVWHRDAQWEVTVVLCVVWNRCKQTPFPCFFGKNTQTFDTRKLHMSSITSGPMFPASRDELSAFAPVRVFFVFGRLRMSRFRPGFICWSTAAHRSATCYLIYTYIRFPSTFFCHRSLKSLAASLRLPMIR